MAPETANQKRKRGRPSNALRDDGDASGSQTRLTRRGQLATAPESTRETDAEESSRPRKRGRQANTDTAPQTQPEPETSQPKRTKKKRGKSPAVEADHNGDEGNEEANTVPPERKRRGRPRVSQDNEENEAEQDNSNDTNENAGPKKRGRPPKASGDAEQEPEANEADDENEENSSFLRRSGRIRRSPNSLNKGTQEAAEPAEGDTSKKRKPKERKRRGRPSLEEQAAEEPEEPAPQPQKKRGRPSLTDQQPAEEANPEPKGRRRQRNRPRSSGEPAASPTRENDQENSIQEETQPRRGRPRRSNDSQPNQRTHRRSSGTHSRSSSTSASPPRYRHLTTRTRRVPRNVIESKWTPLGPPALSSVTTLLQSASRPVLLRLSTANPSANLRSSRTSTKTQQRHAQAAAALNAVGNRLRNKIAKGLPFPPATTSAKREDEFEFERAVAGVQALESQLDPLLHGVELLRREKERAERELEREYKVLARLGANAHAEARQRRDRVRRMHVLVPEKKTSDDHHDENTREVITTEEGSGKVFADIKDEELNSLAGQIANHMESMKGNLQQIDGVVPAIARSQGLLRAALQGRLDREQLENVILG
ncbi:CENP-Q, a CENPA-CAD centromere complex subunit-domain-containing protein [Hypoxylon trugodes]|uniref:CENP-Q, a CENPA-CAD centromere complex subunit-domain-containing protein n=1 Tax=Hypoxylon trugodes TaxID=326681 RepID=UPI0021A20456|nr:CENP-Q, a CENPA-CAD centromere complex subunit-domain-containing protein [Hypoxylon trugodes]KAI1389036.1 CENP-Q, a CENPA-CAD centromere complex subunit-domain-containing protein [Hypoxylon trugodes]